MNRRFNLYKKTIALSLGIILVVGLMGCTTKKECLSPGCSNERIEGTGACYMHGSNAVSNTYKSTKNSYSSSNYKKDSKEVNSYHNDQSTENNFDNYQSSYSTKKYNTRGVYDYDDPDDYASDFAEDYAYDEFGEDSWKAYEYGYEEAYQHWMDEMGE